MQALTHSPRSARVALNRSARHRADSLAGLALGGLAHGALGLFLLLDADQQRRGGGALVAVGDELEGVRDACATARHNI